MGIILGGILAIILGVLGLIRWWVLFLKALAALAPFMLVVGGVLAIIIGITSIKEKDEEKRERSIEESSRDKQS